jgi:hypothetical protein
MLTKEQVHWAKVPEENETKINKIRKIKEKLAKKWDLRTKVHTNTWKLEIFRGSQMPFSIRRE